MCLVLLAALAGCDDLTEAPALRRKLADKTEQSAIARRQAKRYDQLRAELESFKRREEELAAAKARIAELQARLAKK